MFPWLFTYFWIPFVFFAGFADVFLYNQRSQSESKRPEDRESLVWVPVWMIVTSGDSSPLLTQTPLSYLPPPPTPTPLPGQRRG